MLILVAEVGEPVRSSATLAREPIHAQEAELGICIASSRAGSSHLSVLFRDIT